MATRLIILSDACPRTLTTEDTEDTEQSFQQPLVKLIAEFATVFVPLLQNRLISGGMPTASSVQVDHEQVLTERIIGCAIEVHNDLGAGLLEKPYLMGLCVELAHRGIHFERERVIELQYRDVRIGEYIPDLIVENKVVVEIKSVLRDEDVFTANVDLLETDETTCWFDPQLQQTPAEGWHKARRIVKRILRGLRALRG